MPQTGNPCQVSPVSGSGMKPIRLTTKMKRNRLATYGNQSPIAFEGSPCSAICDLGDVVDRLAERLPRIGLDVQPPAHEHDPERIVSTEPSIR